MPKYIKFEIIGPITERRTIAVGNRIRDLARLQRMYGQGRWRKMSGVALIRMPNGYVYLAEIHWYEAHGIGQKDFSYKRLLERKS
jgi:hypothetical protein